MYKKTKVLQKNADIEYVSKNKQDSKIYITGKDWIMRIENEMLSRFNKETISMEPMERSLGSELDFFFDNVLDTVVDYFKEKEEILG
ncbi:MAG: hypothetical protein MJ231_06915 [bacterium]|nr:hypothetical protein [bacterium]